MKNKNGFTLIELLAIVVILSIIMVIAGPSMVKQISKSEVENQNILNQKIENAAHLYMAKYYVKDLISGVPKTFTLKELQEDGLIKLKGSCNDQISNSIAVSGRTYDYSEIKETGCYK